MSKRKATDQITPDTQRTSPNDSPHSPPQDTSSDIKITNMNEIPTLFYNEKNKKLYPISLRIYGKNAGGKLVKFKVLYADTMEEALPNKKPALLTFSKNTSWYLDDNGYLSVNCFIEEISQNHKKNGKPRKFIIEVSIDLDEDNEVASARTHGILVMTRITPENSERYKKQALVKQQKLQQLHEESNMVYKQSAADGVVTPSHTSGTYAVQRLLQLKAYLRKLHQLKRVGTVVVDNYMEDMMPIVDELIGLGVTIPGPPAFLSDSSSHQSSPPLSSSSSSSSCHPPQVTSLQGRENQSGPDGGQSNIEDQVIVEDKQEGDVEDNQEGDVEVNQEGDVEDNQEGDVENNQEGDVEDNQDCDVEDNQEGDVEDNQEGDVEDNQDCDIEDNQEGDVEDNQEGDVEDNQEGDIEDNHVHIEESDSDVEDSHSDFEDNQEGHIEDNQERDANDYHIDNEDRQHDGDDSNTDSEFEQLPPLSFDKMSRPIGASLSRKPLKPRYRDQTLQSRGNLPGIAKGREDSLFTLVKRMSAPSYSEGLATVCEHLSSSSVECRSLLSVSEETPQLATHESSIGNLVSEYF